MWKPLVVLLLAGLLLGCNRQPSPQVQAAVTSTDQPIATPTDSPTATATLTAIPTRTPTTTPSPTASQTPSRTPTSTRRPTSTPTATATLFASSDPVVTELESQGYVTEPVYRFERQPSSGATFFSNMGQFGRTNFAGPDFDDPVEPESLTIRLQSGQTYTYVQYMTPESTTCRLLFFVSDGSNNRLIADIDAAALNDRLREQVTRLLEEPGWPLFCLPYGWSDVNGNGRPDMPVTFLWANNYTGGEVHIFELTDEETIVDLTADLPGPVYHWEFSPFASPLLVVNDAWARHDCLYPNSPFGFWLYDWDGTGYVDRTGDFSYSDYLDYLETLLSGRGPFDPTFHLGPMISLLLTYDYSGQREIGWQKFVELAAPQNWPGSEPEALAWLQDDVTHLTAEYEAGLPFTPNDAGCR